MREADELTTILSEWVVKAEADWACASRLLKERNDWATDVTCFHAQQCVEKYLKALLVLNRTDFPKTHDIRRLVEMLPASMRPDLSKAEQDTLTPYATVTRYPGGPELFDVRLRKEAVALARRVRKHARGLLPRKALCSRRS